MSVAAMQEIVDPHPFTAPLLPIMGVVFVGFLVVGVAMPVLPLYVHDGLGFGPFVVGLVADRGRVTILTVAARSARSSWVCSRPPRPGCSTFAHS